MARSSSSPTERTPLVPPQPGTEHIVKRGWFPSLHRVLFTTCLLALTFAFTQTSLMYGFRRMTCEDYDLHHPDAIEPVPDRCTVRRIEADTASSISIMATSTMTFTVVNVFLTGWWIKRFGPKSAMFQQSFWLCFRNMCQMYAISHGGRRGINIIQSTQIFNVLGSAGGYQLAANSYVALLVDADRRTGMFGVLSGMVMLGNSAGYSLGGLTERLFGPLAPFQTAFCMLVFCTIFGALCLPYIAPTKTAASSDGKKASGAASFLAPLALFIPRRIMYEDGSRGPRQWSLLFLALGAFFSVFATAFVPLGLQLVSTNVFGFRPAETGLMLSLTLLVKALFLSICFPAIIKYGRKWYTRPATPATVSSTPKAFAFPPIGTGASSPARIDRTGRNPSEATLINSAPVSPKTIPAPLPATTPASRKHSRDDPSLDFPHPEDPHEVVLSTPARPDQIAIPPAPTDVKHGSTFDLHFLRYSILLDAVLTSLTSLMTRGWHIYVAAAILPLASGTGAACKGVATDFVDADTRASVLSAIALVENLATVSTACLFGFVFAALSEAGLPTLVFLVNGCMALIAFFVLLVVRMPKVQTHLA